jgi:hypothetical protein
LILGFFCFFFSPFSGAFAVYGRTGLCIFQMALPRVNTRVFLFFFSALFRRVRFVWQNRTLYISNGAAQG